MGGRNDIVIWLHTGKPVRVAGVKALRHMGQAVLQTEFPEKSEQYCSLSQILFNNKEVKVT